MRKTLQKTAVQRSFLEKVNFRKTSPWELIDPQTTNDSDETQDIRIPFDPLTAHKIDILIKQLLCQFEGLLVF